MTLRKSSLNNCSVITWNESEMTSIRIRIKNRGFHLKSYDGGFIVTNSKNPSYDLIFLSYLDVVSKEPGILNLRLRLVLHPFIYIMLFAVAIMIAIAYYSLGLQILETLFMAMAFSLLVLNVRFLLKRFYEREMYPVLKEK